MQLLPRELIVKTGSVDHADWNYRPLLGFASRRRFALIRSLLPSHTPRILEVGFGSGIFLPELASRCDELYGIDIHDRVADVQRVMERSGVRVQLARSDAAQTPFEAGFFDRIVAVSALEFIENIEACARDLARILRPGGRLLCVMPGQSKLLDAALRFATGEDAERDYADRRGRVMPALLGPFSVLRKTVFFPIYTAYELAHRTV